MEEDDTERLQQDHWKFGDVVHLNQGDNSDNRILVSYTYSEENSDQHVPPSVQRLWVVQPITSLPNKFCYIHEHLGHLRLPMGLRYIGERAFFGCQSLQEVNLPLSIKAIYESAFEECSSLVTVNQQQKDGEGQETESRQKMNDQHSKSIGRLVVSKYKSWRKTNGSTGSDGVIEYRAFKGCTSLQTIEVSGTMRSIKESAFEDCRCLLELNLPDKLAQIQSCAYKNCKSLQSIQIPSTVDALGSYSFLRCSSLVDVTLAEGLKAIGNYAFTYCSSLEEIKIPWSVKMIEKGAFSFCEYLKTVDLPNSQAEIHSRVFHECSSLRRMSLPPTNKILNSDVFSNCRWLVQLFLPEGLVGIGHSALRYCKSLQSVALPKSLKRIHDYAISGCTSLVSVEIPKGTKAKLSSNCFQGCVMLANIAISPPMAKLFAEQEVNHFSGCILLELQYAADRTGQSVSQCLQHRFENYPVHELCYYASSTTRAELEQQASKSVRGAEHLDMKSIQDEMGMTPFHVLLSAPTRRIDLLEVLLDAYPATVLLARNEHKISSMEYLLSNWTAEARLMMRKCLQKCVLDPLQSCGVDAWRSHMSQIVESICAGEKNDVYNSNSESHLEAKLSDALASLSMYKKLEVTSLLEQWLWKMALLSTQNDRESEVERSTCRARCGAFFIIPIVMTFLDDAKWGRDFGDYI